MKKAWLCIYALLNVVAFLSFCGCIGSLVGENKQREIIEIKFYDPDTGRPMKVCKIIDTREVEVMFLDEYGKPIIKKLKLTGGMYTPPPLPELKTMDKPK